MNQEIGRSYTLRPSVAKGITEPLSQTSPEVKHAFPSISTTISGKSEVCAQARSCDAMKTNYMWFSDRLLSIHKALDLIPSTRK